MRRHLITTEWLNSRVTPTTTAVTHVAEKVAFTILPTLWHPWLCHYGSKDLFVRFVDVELAES
jgi:hypothetical protein